MGFFFHIDLLYLGENCGGYCWVSVSFNWFCGFFIRVSEYASVRNLTSLILLGIYFFYYSILGFISVWLFFHLMRLIVQGFYLMAGLKFSDASAYLLFGC